METNLYGTGGSPADDSPRKSACLKPVPCSRCKTLQSLRVEVRLAESRKEKDSLVTRSFAAVFRCLIFVAALGAPARPLCAGWRAGTAKEKITPAAPMPMAGYASRGVRPATGALTDLWAKVLVLEDGRGTQAALVTLDLVGIDRDLSLEIREQIALRRGWNLSQIVLCCSHTHTGPVVKRNLAAMHYFLYETEIRRQIDDYAAQLVETATRLVDEAVGELHPVELRWGSGSAGFAVNRRNNVEGDVPQLIESGGLQGPVDHETPTLLVQRGDAPLAVVFGYACHCTTLADFRWSGDYAGFAQRDLEERLPGAQAMFFAGCGADQNPLPRRSVQRAQQYGRELADAVSETLAGDLASIGDRLATAYREIDLAFGGLPDREALEAEAGGGNAYAASRARHFLNELEEGRGIPASYPYPIAVWQLGAEATWLFLGGEVVVDYALRLKPDLAADGGSVWCAAYANDVMAYIPSRRVLLEGGYEGGGSMIYYGLPAAWAPEIEDDIVRTATTLVREARESLAGE